MRTCIHIYTEGEREMKIWVGEKGGGRTHVPCWRSVKTFCNVVISFSMATEIEKFIPNILVVIVALIV